MKVENLKHPFTLQEIIENFGDYKIFFKKSFLAIFFPKNKEFVTDYSIFKIFFKK
jgi:hypothetical protein